MANSHDPLGIKISIPGTTSANNEASKLIKKATDHTTLAKMTSVISHTRLGEIDGLGEIDCYMNSMLDKTLSSNTTTTCDYSESNFQKNIMSRGHCEHEPIHEISAYMTPKKLPSQARGEIITTLAEKNINFYELDSWVSSSFNTIFPNDTPSRLKYYLASSATKINITSKY